MLVEVESKKVCEKAINEPNLSISRNICKYSYYDLIDINWEIKSNKIVQMVLAMFNHYNNKENPIQLALSEDLSMFEVISSHTIQLLCKLCLEVRLLFDKLGRPMHVYLKKPITSASESFLKLKKMKEVDLSINAIFPNKVILDYQRPNNIRMFQLVTDNQISDADIFKISIQNYFLSFMIVQCIRNKNYFGFPILGWKAAEIDSIIYFNYLSSVFKEVYFAGHEYNGNWHSTHLIVVQPIDSLFDFMKLMTD